MLFVGRTADAAEAAGTIPAGAGKMEGTA
jgi:hypothetical protein